MYANAETKLGKLIQGALPRRRGKCGHTLPSNQSSVLVRSPEGKGFSKETTSGAYAYDLWGPPLQEGFGW
ncbi:hypothetical protein PCCS19_32070 [Paenibacillus sp. CCS19]|nr:hypothetical protein PCCS19_32070 [Paenibacillus cellulosilyticus]